jgi:hypothetical protein
VSGACNFIKKLVELSGILSKIKKSVTNFFPMLYRFAGKDNYNFPSEIKGALKKKPSVLLTDGPMFLGFTPHVSWFKFRVCKSVN